MRKQGGRISGRAVITSVVTLEILDDMNEGMHVSSVAQKHGLAEGTVVNYFNAIRRRMRLYEIGKGNLALDVRKSNADVREKHIIPWTGPTPSEINNANMTKFNKEFDKGLLVLFLILSFLIVVFAVTSWFLKGA